MNDTTQTNEDVASLSWLDIVFVVCLPVIALLPALAGGFPMGHDWRFELVRIVEFGHAFAEGQALPLWAPNLYFGFGSPIFLFYAPLYAALSSAITACGVTLDVASVLALLVFGWVGSVYSWKFGAALAPGAASRSAGRLTAAFYLLSPYLLGNALARNANAELTALLLAPMPLYGIVLIRSRVRHGTVLLATGFALVIFAHNLTALTFAVFAVTLAVALYASRARLALLGACAFALILGLLLSAVFWLPAIGFVDEVRQADLTSGKFDFRNNFEPLSAYVGADNFFSPGPVATAMLALLVATLVLTRKTKPSLIPPLFASIILAFAGIALLLPQSTTLWEHLPFLKLFQFPWRFCGAVALATAIGLGPCVSWWLGQRTPRMAHRIEYTLVLLFVASAVPAWRAYEPLPDEVKESIGFTLTPASIRALGMPATVKDDYLPPGADSRAARALKGNAPPVLLVEGGAIVASQRAIGTRLELQVQVREGARLTVSRWASPVWRVRIGERVVPVERGTYGLLAFRVPSGESRVTVEVVQPFLRRLGIALGILGLALLAALLAIPALAKTRTESSSREIDTSSSSGQSS